MIHRWRMEVGGSRQTDRQVCLELGMRYAPPSPQATCACALLAFLVTKNAFIFCGGPAQSCILLLFPTLLESICYLGRGLNRLIDADLECNHDREPERRMWAMQRGYDKCMLRSVFLAS